MCFLMLFFCPQNNSRQKTGISRQNDNIKSDVCYNKAKRRKETELMKKMLFKVLTASAPAIAALTVFMAKIFAASPCVGTYYEPEMPEELKR